MDVNCKNADGLTPLLLVTRDLNLFEKSKIIINEIFCMETCVITRRKRLIFIFLFLDSLSNIMYLYLENFSE